MVAARLYDVDGATQRLIARGVQRPLGVGAGPTEQVFQLHPQAWTVQPGHVLKLELLAQDSPYLRTPTGQQSVDGQRPAAAAAGRRRARARDLGGRHASPRRRPSSSRPGYKLAREYATEATGSAGGTVPATLSLTLGAPATFGAFTPGVDREYTASHDGDRDLAPPATRRSPSSDPGPPDQRRVLACPQPLRVELAHGDAGPAPVSNAAVDDHVPASASAPPTPLRTGTYAKTLTFTLSTTNP